MPIPTFLALNAFGSLPLQVHEISGGTSSTKIGSDISTGSPAVYVPSEFVKANHSAYALTFKGERFCATGTAGNYHIRRENEGGAGNWGIVYTPTSGATSNGPEQSGLKIVKDGNDTALVFAWPRSAGGPGNGIVILKSNTGQSGSWTEQHVALGHSPRFSTTTAVFRNRLYVCDAISLGANNPTRVYEIDPEALSVTVIAAPWEADNNVRCAADFCVAFDRLFCAAVDEPSAANGVLSLYEFTGGGWTFNGQIGATLGHNSNGLAGRSKYCLWTDNTNLYVVGYTEKNDINFTSQPGSTVWRGVPSGSTFTWSQNDTTMVSGLRPLARGLVTLAREDRWSIYVDNDTDPAAPDYYLIVAEGPAPGTGFSIYQWNGFGVEMGPAPGASVSISFALPETKHGGAEAISQGVASWAEIVDEAAIVGGYRLSYRVYGTQGPYTGRVYFSVEQGPPDTLATLVGGGTTIASVTGDNGVALRTVDVDLSLSGITPPDASTWMIDLRA